MKNTVKMGRVLANALTLSRAVLSVLLLFFKPFSVPFTCLYIAAGLTDMLDGPTARLTGSAGDLGARLDTGADVIFAAVCLMKILPERHLPLRILGWIGLIALVKGGNILWVLCKNRTLLADHGWVNKAVGILLFCLPLTVSRIGTEYSIPAVCALATLGALLETYQIFVKGK